MAGNFGRIAPSIREPAKEFVSRLGIKPGAKVLDIACGTGNSAIPAARSGARVTGVDIAPNLLEQARQWAAEENVDAAFDEGDAEQLPYGDAQFDVVMTMFGAMFAPRPDRVAAEMVRVGRPGGVIAMANWAPAGFVARMFAAGARFVPPPEGMPSPLLWGEEAIVRTRLANGTSSIRTTHRKIPMEFSLVPKDVVELFRTYFGPIQMTFSKLDSTKQAEYASELEELFRDHNEASGDRTLVRGEYLEVIATRA
jgi:SAM-dependent methyltransferase